jgi:hypothetical protein
MKNACNVGAIINATKLISSETDMFNLSYQIEPKKKQKPTLTSTPTKSPKSQRGTPGSEGKQLQKESPSVLHKGAPQSTPSSPADNTSSPSTPKRGLLGRKKRSATVHNLTPEPSAPLSPRNIEKQRSAPHISLFSPGRKKHNPTKLFEEAPLHEIVFRTQLGSGSWLSIC